MSTGTILLAVSLGLAAGVLSGLFGVGGGILFVPTLVALGLGQVEAAATSSSQSSPRLLSAAGGRRATAICALRQALTVGVASIAGVEIGVQIATSLPEHVLRRLFGVLLVARGGAARVACLPHAHELP